MFLLIGLVISTISFTIIMVVKETIQLGRFLFLYLWQASFILIKVALVVIETIKLLRL